VGVIGPGRHLAPRIVPTPKRGFVTIRAQRHTWADIARNRPLMTLMLGHFMIDSYVGLLPVLYPLLISRFTLNLTTVGLISLAYSGVSSISQPLFGWLADRAGTRLIGLTTLWTAAMFAMIGFAPSFALIVLLAGTAGLGSGAFHPFGAVNASAAIPPAQRNTAMSVYVTGGTLGVALGPLIGAVIFTLFGIQGTLAMLAPGLVIGGYLLYTMRAARRGPAAPRRPGEIRRALPLLSLAAVVGVMMSRNWTMISTEAFVPAWYASMGYPASFYGPLATTLILSSAVGTVGCGSLADRFGRRAVIIATLCMTIPALILFARYPGPFAFVTAALVGFSAASTGPLMLVMAQQLMAGRAGLASGLVLGLGFITGAIGVPITGMIADRFGAATAIESQVLLVVATIGLACLLPSERKMRELVRSA
jgi:FSR family fosmidomycin resistance protein-like MFS transporter